MSTRIGWICLLLLSWTCSVFALEPLPADKAFAIQTHFNAKHQLLIEWRIARDDYLYRDKTVITLGDHNTAQIGTIIYPPGKMEHDSDKGDYPIYTKKVTVIVPVLSRVGWLDLNIHYQGCSFKGFCYPPIQKTVTVDLSQLRDPENITTSLAVSAPSVVSEQDYLTQLLAGHHLLLIVFVFLGLGVLLAFTPCILPMIPILSGIIVNHHSRQHITHQKAFLLSFSYVLGMALTYMVLGIIAAWLGSSVQAALEQPWIIILLSVLFVLLAFSLFGFYELRLPASWQNRLMNWDKHLHRGTYPATFLMGSFSSLMVSPCVTAPLIGVLTYIAQTGDKWLGALALFTLGMGMGIPLMIVGAFAKTYLPKSGPWMLSIQKLLGVIMLGMAIGFLSRVIANEITTVLYGVLFVALALVLGTVKHVRGLWNKLLKMAGILSLLYGLMLMGNVMFKYTHLEQWQSSAAPESTSLTIVRSVSQLDLQLKQATKEHRPVIIDFYANWCVNCKRIEKTVMNDPSVQTALKNKIVLRVDMTDNTPAIQAILKQYQILAPPVFLFFNQYGKELSHLRIVGEMNKNELLERLNALNE